MKRNFLHISLLITLIGALMSPINTGAAPQPLRTVTVSFTYSPLNVYDGRLTNSKAAFTLLQKFLFTLPSRTAGKYSFVNDVIGGKFHERDGFVWTTYGYAYGTCGAASLLHQLIRAAFFIDANGHQQPLFEIVQYKREINPTYGRYGAAIFIDLDGKRTSDFVWRLNPDYHGPIPRIGIHFKNLKGGGAVVTMSARYADELPRWGG